MMFIALVILYGLFGQVSSSPLNQGMETYNMSLMTKRDQHYWITTNVTIDNWTKMLMDRWPSLKYKSCKQNAASGSDTSVSSMNSQGMHVANISGVGCIEIRGLCQMDFVLNRGGIVQGKCACEGSTCYKADKHGNFSCGPLLSHVPFDPTSRRTPSIPYACACQRPCFGKSHELKIHE